MGGGIHLQKLMKCSLVCQGRAVAAAAAAEAATAARATAGQEARGELVERLNIGMAKAGGSYGEDDAGASFGTGAGLWAAATCCE